MGMFTGARKTAPLGGLVMRTTGGRLVGGGPGRTVMLTGAETVEAPPLSVATAVRDQVLAGTFCQFRKYTSPVTPFTPGGSRTTGCPRPKSVVPAKNSTFVTEPSGSAARASSEMLTGV